MLTQLVGRKGVWHVSQNKLRVFALGSSVEIKVPLTPLEHTITSTLAALGVAAKLHEVGTSCAM
jgi:hypothetical protein